MPRVAKFVLPLLIIAAGGWMLGPWIGEHLATRARTAYFNQGRAHAPGVLEELGPLPPELRESSGIAVSRTQPGVLWSHNDSGDAPTLYAIDLKGRLLAKVAVETQSRSIGRTSRPARVRETMPARSHASTSPIPATTIDRGTS